MRNGRYRRSWATVQGRPLLPAHVGYPVAQFGSQLSGDEIAQPVVAGRPIAAGGGSLSERPVHFETLPSPTATREAATAVIRRWPASTGKGSRLNDSIRSRVLTLPAQT
jgi:hypothetical protein